ncbi:MAG: pyridoxamine 5'-phosphate oxidase family protein [Actinomycetota bacterium]
MTDHDLGALYGDGSRALQDTFDSRRLADRLQELTIHDELTDDDIGLIEAQTSVLVSTVDEVGWPDVSYKGGDPGFVRVVDRRTLVMPSYDGNGMFRSLGNIAADPRLAMLFVDTTRPWRLRLHGVGRVETAGPVVDGLHGAQAALVVEIRRLFPNCGRYIDQGTGPAPHVPREGEDTPEPEWKKMDLFRPYLPQQPT